MTLTPGQLALYETILDMQREALASGTVCVRKYRTLSGSLLLMAVAPEPGTPQVQFKSTAGIESGDGTVVRSPEMN